ncbi:MAG: hypothetical protein ABW003_04725 [Microvirga sp.]
MHADTATALSSYLQSFSSGRHVAEARQRLAILEEQRRKEADEAGWADALRVGTSAALSAYLTAHSSGAHIAEAHRRIAALEEQARKEADDMAWSEALRSGTATAITAYIERFSSGAHVTEARQRLTALEAERRKALDNKALDDKAWADALQLNTVQAITAYIQKFSSGAHVAEARQRLTTLEQARKQAAIVRRNAAGIPIVDIKKTCRAAASVAVGLGSTIQQSISGCVDSEQMAREQIAKDLATFSSADRALCIRASVYLPSYVEWLTCLEMERDVRKLKQQQPSATTRSTGRSITSR